MLYFNQGKYEEALQTFTKAIELKSDLATIYYYLGLTHAQLGNNWEALTAFEKTISLDSTYPRVYYDLGVVYYRMGNYPQALKSFEMAEKREPERAMIYYFKAHILYLQNKFFESLPYFTKAGELDPGLKQTTHFFSGLALLKLDRKKEAEQELQSSLTIDPTSELGNAAQGYLDSIKAKQPRALKKWNLTASLSYQYDDNVVLEPDGASSTTDVSHEGDSRGVVFIDG
jgi:tetratricopeptide (TPR) repeat protein